MKQVVIISILIFGCNIAWGECPNTAQGLITRDRCIANNFIQIDKLLKEIELLKDRIAELESQQGAQPAKVTVIEESKKEDDIYYFSGGEGHSCGGYIRNGAVNNYAIWCAKCNQNMIDDIKRRHSK